jgi:KDO2-lipid IV(A) lauroyltransferase
LKKKIRRALALLLVKTLILFTRIVPRKLGLSLFSALGLAAFRFYRKDRERALSNIAAAFPQGDPLITRAMARGSFVALGKNGFDALRLSYLSREKVLDLCTVEGEENLKIPYERGKGVVALTGHIGCWELLAAYFSEKGYSVDVIARDLQDERMNELLVTMRRRHGIESIPRGTSAIAGYKVLKRGKILGMLIDQDIDVEGVFVPFFGRPAHTTIGSATFAMRSGAAIVPLAIHMQPGGRHHITVLPELEIPTEDMAEEERIYELTARCSEAVEKLIRIYPQQWVWLHDRWHKKPGGDVGVPDTGCGEEAEASFC